MDDTLLNQIEPDMVMRPDYATTSAAPWTADVTLQIIHDVYDQNNELYPVAPRNVLKRVIALYQDMGLKPIVAPEMEFFLVAPNIDPNQPIEPLWDGQAGGWRRGNPIPCLLLMNMGRSLMIFMILPNCRD